MSIAKEIVKLLPPRKKTSHKGNYGRVLILAGSQGLSGACVLASEAAVRSGAGLVTVGVPRSLLLPLTKRFTEAMMKPFPETSSGSLGLKALKPVQDLLKTQDVLALGPGLSQNKETQKLIRRIALNSKKTMVLDADGLTAFVHHTNLFRKLKAEVILTPHPGEFVRLFSAKGRISPSAEAAKIPRTETERKNTALSVAKKFKVVVVLKGSQTVVASPNGKVFVNSTGNPGMATGGTGDVLTGVIAALLGQGLAPFDAARAGVYIHGLTGDLAKKKFGEISLTAGDVLQTLPAAFRKALKR